MKRLHTFALLGFAGALHAPLGGQTLPTPLATSVTADPSTGALRTPANFWTANQTAIAASLSTDVGQPHIGGYKVEEPAPASGGNWFPVWSSADDFFVWHNAGMVRTELGLDPDDAVVFGGIQAGSAQIAGEVQAFSLRLGAFSFTEVLPSVNTGVSVTMPTVSGTLLTTTGNGNGLTALNASAFTTGTVPNARLDADLAALGNATGTGLWTVTAAGTGSLRTLTAPAAGITITNPAGTAGNPTFGLANDLAAVEGLSTTGLATRTGTDAWAARTLTGTANQITVTNGNGVSGNPTISLPPLVILPGSLRSSATSPVIAGPDMTNETALFAGKTSLLPVVTPDGTDGVLSVYADTIFGARIHSENSNGITASSANGQAAKFIQTGIAATSNIPVVRIHRADSDAATTSPLVVVSDGEYTAPGSGGSVLRADKGGTVLIDIDNEGRLILRAPGNGSYWRLNVSDTGALSTTSVPSP